MDMGGFVIIINAEKVQVGGAKEDQKIYYRHSGRPGGLKQETFRQLQAVHLSCLSPDPAWIVSDAVADPHSQKSFR